MINKIMEIKNYISEGKDPSDWRGCLMLSFPKDISEAIQAWGDRKIPSDVLVGNGREKYSHCTVLYGFSQGIAFADVKDFLEKGCNLTDKSRLRVKLGEVRRFECPEFDVLHIAVEDCMPLHNLHFALKEKFHVKTSYATYNPHATVAYVQKGACKELDGCKLFVGIEVACNQLTYSTGPSENRGKQEINYESFQERLGRSSKTELM